MSSTPSKSPKSKRLQARWTLGSSGPGSSPGVRFSKVPKTVWARKVDVKFPKALSRVSVKDHVISSRKFTGALIKLPKTPLGTYFAAIK